MNKIQRFTIVLLKLPDGKLALQRRTDDAPYAPGKLGLFGGWVEVNETPEQCIARELKEETSLDVPELDITLVEDFVMPVDKDFAEDRHFYLFETEIDTLDFEVYEGKGAEAFTLERIKKRDDLNGSAAYVFTRIL